MKTLFLIIALLVSNFTSQAQLKIGDTLPNATLKNGQNQEINLTSFKGKVVLLDFWASWCAPCRMANIEMVKLYKQYGGASFDIVGISLDDSKTQWLAAIKNDKITYTQLNQAKGFYAPIAETFGIDEIPSTFLFDKKGKLVAKNPTQKQIINLIKKASK
jgi:thiol-disulfide isomerase/thioredoxin